MTKIEPAKVVIFIVVLAGVGILINSASNHNWRQRSVIATPPQTQPATSSVPSYPVEKTVPMNQNDWVTITVQSDEHLNWNPVERDVWMDTRINNTDPPFTQPPMSDPKWQPISTGDITRIIQFRVTPGTPVKSGTLWYRITSKK